MVDKKLVEEAIKMLLKGMGEDPERQGLVGTPDRVARMYEELLAGYEDASLNHHQIGRAHV